MSSTLFLVFALSLCAALSSALNPGTHYLTPKEANADITFTDCYPATDGDSIFKYSVANLNKSLPAIQFSKLTGKVILVLNVATFCRSATDYPQLNALKDKFGKQLEIIGFPCAQFWNQEPEATAEEIFNAIRYVRPGNGFVPKFNLTEKVEVNGVNTHPVFSFLKRSCPSTETRFQEQKYYFWDPKNERDIKWNFEKFLINGKTGQAVRRYDTSFNASLLQPDIEQLIKQLTIN